LYPPRHGMIAADAKLRADLPSMASALRGSGRWRAGVTGNGFISTRWGFGEGWDKWRNNLHEGGGLSAADLVKTALDLLRPQVERPFFFYIGTIDAHTSWRAREPWLSRYDAANGPYQGPFVKACTDPQEEKIVTGQLKINERDKLRIK